MNTFIGPKTLVETVMDACSDRLCYLKMRWMDENEYEDFNEYRDAMAKCAKAVNGVEFIDMSKRPWGFTWKGCDGFVRKTFIKGHYIETVRIN